ncbi:hypothetical protein [Flavobacterium caseinilyticum]|uniref:Uncharacterized protein n=1 Tax=Flavobacterium caseinilyticum TaxID=2541732 RepID=A0A4R5AX41_9FLAO|nr:hypothetical protein [Flavobacterium caseinilyticum]TDD77135.1 hypothetical protein E0F89_05920 [Flavobacterium caseinilyticum]
MKKLFLMTFLVCFVFSSFATLAVPKVYPEKHKTEKIAFEATAPVEVKKVSFVPHSVVAFQEHRKKEVAIATVVPDLKVTKRFTYNYSYPWCRNQKDVVWLIDIYK